MICLDTVGATRWSPTRTCAINNSLENNFFLQVYFNAQTETTAFALIKEDKRAWGIDFDSIRGWHLHPVENPDDHLIIETKTIKEIIAHLAKVWDVITGKKS